MDIYKDESLEINSNGSLSVDEAKDIIGKTVTKIESDNGRIRLYFSNGESTTRLEISVDNNEGLYAFYENF
jgi:hypothetical protein